MNLPDIEHTCRELGQRLAAYVQEQQLEQPLLVGIRTGGVWVAERLQEAIRRLAIEHRSSDVATVLTLSIGSATLPPNAGASVEQHLNWADEQLYRAKAEGRDRICGQTYTSPLRMSSEA